MCNRLICIVLISGGILGIFAVSAFPHNNPNAKVPSLQALKVDAALQVDGVLDEPFWQEADTATDLIEQRSREIAPDRTVVRVAYTRTYLYIAVECFDEKIHELHATEKREDRDFRGDDWVEIHFDPLHTHRSKYAFFSNPLGTRRDANEGPSAEFNPGWSADWDLAAKILQDRWIFEMRIPISVMNYYRKDGQTWGFNITRFVPRNDSLSFWCFNPTDFYKPRHFGHLTGLDLADNVFKRNWEVSPYVSSRMDFNHKTEFTPEAGIDTSFRLTPSIISSWTLNPDFGQIEADDDTIELRDTERFLTEKRPFFREGEELMRMRHSLYYSRRFTDIQAGGKISGRMGDTSFNFLDIQGDITHGDQRSGNSSVFRGLQDIGEISSLGYYLSDSELDDGHSRVAGMDGDLYFNRDMKFRFQASASDDRTQDLMGQITKNRFDYLGYGAFIYDKYPWDINLDYTAISKEFDPALGYIPRRDFFGPSLRTQYSIVGDNRWFKSWDTVFVGQYYENEDSQTVLRDFTLDSHIIFANDYGLMMGGSENYHRPFYNHRISAGVSMHNSDYWRSADFSWTQGVFEEINYNEFTLGKRLKPLEPLPLRDEFTIRFEDNQLGNKETVWLNRLVFDYYFTDKMWVKTSIQNRNQSLHNISVIYGWEFHKNTHWYVVLNSVKDTGDLYVEGPIHSIFTKIVYTF